MNVVGLRRFSVFLVLLVFLSGGKAVNVDQPSTKDGAIVVNVTWGDIDNTPANDVYIEAHGFVPKYDALKSFVLKMSHPGQYEVSLPPAVYDVFISEGTSVPRCKRLLVRAGDNTYWRLKLEIDEVYTQH